GRPVCARWAARATARAGSRSCSRRGRTARCGAWPPPSATRSRSWRGWRSAPSAWTTSRRASGGGCLRRRSRGSSRPRACLSGVRDTVSLRAAMAYRRELETYSSPILYATFGAAATSSYDRDRLTFQAVSMAAFVAGLLLVARAFGLGPLLRLLVLLFALEW